MIAAHDWVGELSSNGSIVPLSPSAALKKQFPAAALDAFSYGVAVKRLYGVPLYVENVALLTNLKLAKVPTTWASLEAQAQAAKKKTKAPVGIAVQQGSGGDAYHMYPFFTSLCGYIFGKNSAGNLDPSDIGVANRKFLANAPAIDRWNKSGLIRSTVTDGIAKTLFTTGKTAYYITGAWNLDDIKKSGLKFAVSAVPEQQVQDHAVHRLRRPRRDEVRLHARRRVAGEGLRRQLHDAGRPAVRPLHGGLAAAREHGRRRAHQGPVPEGLRQRRRYRQPDAEHPADGVGVERSRPGVGSLDEGLGLDPGPAGRSSPRRRAIALKIG